MKITVTSLEKLIANREALGIPESQIEPLRQELEQLRQGLKVDPNWNASRTVEDGVTLITVTL
jgi:hypothetical protein